MELSHLLRFLKLLSFFRFRQFKIDSKLITSNGYLYTYLHHFQIMVHANCGRYYFFQDLVSTYFTTHYIEFKRARIAITMQQQVAGLVSIALQIGRTCLGRSKLVQVIRRCPFLRIRQKVEHSMKPEWDLMDNE